MLRSQIRSLTNPIGGSAAFSHGTKSGENFVTFSVGTAAVGSSYVSKNSDDEDVTFSIYSGILTFSYPQTHSYIGVGDVVSSAGDNVYLNRKINTNQWAVTDQYGNAPSDVSDVTLIAIDKTFNSLLDAIHDTGSGAEVLLRTNDLVTLGSTLRIVLYVMTDTSADSVNVTGWTTDEYNYVRLFTPYDIRTECNSKQRHLGIINTGYTFNKTGGSTSIWLRSNYTEMEGLCVNTASSGVCINVSSGSYVGCKVLHNVVKGALSSNIYLNASAIAVGNISYDGLIGIRDSGNDAILINNTIVDCPTGIQGGAGTQSWNNLIKGSITACLSGVGIINNTITSDATGDIQNATIVFRDETSDDFHIDFNSIDSLVVGADPITGGDSTVTSLFLFDRDIDTELMAGNGWPIGADRFVPEPHFAIGKDITTDLNSGGNVTIVNPHTNDLVLKAMEGPNGMMIVRIDQSYFGE